MATIIKLKRGTSTPTTSDLANGEVGIDTSAKKFYINDSGTIKEIAGGTSGGDSSSPLSGDVRGYTGDGSTVGFTVTSGATVENVLVFLNGVFQRPTTDYTVSSTTLTFGTAPVNNDVITIKELVEGKNTFLSSSVVRGFTGDGSTTGFTVSSGKSVSQFLVFINGVFQRPTNDFTYSGSTLTFGTAPVNGDIITIKEIIESTAVDLTSISTDLTPDTHNAYDVGQLGSAFRDFTFVRKIQKNVEIFTRAIGLGTVATNLGFNINTSAANMTQVFTNAGGLENPVLGGGNATFDDNNPAFLF